MVFSKPFLTVARLQQRFRFSSIPTPSASSTLVPYETSHVFYTAKKLAEIQDRQGDWRSFCIVDLDHVRRQYKLWKMALPSVKPYYAVKCLNDEHVLWTLADLGAGFDCASHNELAQVFGIRRNADVILAHPVKIRDCIFFAVENGVLWMTFDSFTGLHTMAQCSRLIRPILRIKVEGFDSIVNLNEKFGANESMSRRLLKNAAKHKLPIYGICFHSGSGVTDMGPMEATLVKARELWDYGLKLGHPMEVLDIGGGMVWTNDEHFFKLGATVESALAKTFGDVSVKIVAEPGRYFATEAQHCVTKVLQVDLADQETEKYRVIVNEGVYSSFNYAAMENRISEGLPLHPRSGEMKVDIWGNTCCSMDILERGRTISTLKEGDWLIYRGNGAYSTVLGTNFNGFELPRRHYIGIAYNKRK